jgi:hypothetical protein
MGQSRCPGIARRWIPGWESDGLRFHARKSFVINTIADWPHLPDEIDEACLANYLGRRGGFD